jgi:hypothetical protein
MFGVGRSAGIEKTSLISLTSEERRARPHIRVGIGGFRIAVEPRPEPGLRVRSQVMAEKPVTIRRERMGNGSAGSGPRTSPGAGVGDGAWQTKALA